MTELPPIEYLDLEGSAEASEASEASETGGEEPEEPDEPEEAEEGEESEEGEEAEEVEEVEVYFSIETHRCQTVFDWQQRFCDQEFIPEFTINYGEGEVQPRGNEDVFKCSSAKCPVCLDLDKDMLKVNVFTTILNLIDSAAKGCGTCETLHKAIEKWAQAAVLEDDELSPSTIVHLGHLDYGPVTLKLSDPVQSWEDFKIGEHYASLELYTPTEIQSSWPAFGVGRHLSPEISVKECVAFAKEQIENCEKHESCKPSHRMQCPSRALDLGPENDQGAIKLTDYAAHLGPYITLSHCWGTTQSMVSTTSSNLEERRRSIQVADLPKTFRDAVNITQGLGIRYLWIDSLCIIQNDLADWEIESTKMADVYSGAFLTIAATKSSNCDGGCLSNRATQAGRPFETLTIDGTCDGKQVQVLVREALMIAHNDTLFSSSGSATAPLFQRAWCFQERLLSPKLLHFHPDEMVWVCRNTTACECGYLQNIPPDSNQVLRENIRLLNQAMGGIGPGALDQSAIWKIWKTTVELYPQLSITQETDRLPAMSGIATRFASVIQGSYLAGIWEESIPAGLTWLTDQQASRRRRNILGVPSWSWISLQVSGGMPPISLGEQFYDGSFTPDLRFKLVKFDSTPATRNPFGPLLNTAMIIEGAYIMVTYHLDPADFFFPCSLQVGDEEHPFYTDTKPDDSSSSTTATAEITKGDKLLCLLLGTKGKRIEPEHMIGTDDGLQDMALVLKQNDDGGYRRVGLYVDYLRKKWFASAVEIERVAIQ